MNPQDSVVSKPQAGSQETVSISDQQETNFAFSTNDISGLKITDSGELLIQFKDGGSLLLENFTELADGGVEVTLSDNTTFDFKEILESLIADIPSNT